MKKILLSDVVANLRRDMEKIPAPYFVDFFLKGLVEKFGNSKNHFSSTKLDDITITPIDMMVATICILNDFKKLLIKNVPTLVKNGTNFEFTSQFLGIFSKTFYKPSNTATVVTSGKNHSLDNFNIPTDMEAKQAAALINYNQITKLDTKANVTTKILLSEIIENFQIRRKELPDQDFVDFFIQELAKKFVNCQNYSASADLISITITPYEMMLAIICTITDFSKFLISIMPIIVEHGTEKEFLVEFLSIFSKTFYNSTNDVVDELEFGITPQSLDQFNTPTDMDIRQAEVFIDFYKTAC